MRSRNRGCGFSARLAVLSSRTETYPALPRTLPDSPRLGSCPVTRAPPRVGPGTQCGTSFLYTSGEPRRLHMITTRLALIPGLLLTLGGCMTNATVELTKAPTPRPNSPTAHPEPPKSSSIRRPNLHQARRRALADVRLLRAKQKATVFAMHTHENLRADIARNQGNILRRWLPSPASPSITGRTFRTA